MLLSGYQASIGDPMSIRASGRYLLFLLRARHSGGTQAPYLQAYLARIDLKTGAVTTLQLQVPVMAQINGAFDQA